MVHARARALLAGVLALAAAPAYAQTAPARAQPFEAVLTCREVKADAARLACYDAAAGRMGEAERKGEIVVIDKAQAQKANKEAFGLPMPSLSILTKALTPDEVATLEGTIRSLKADANGKWTVELEGGAVWRQIAGDLHRRPKVGHKVAIRKASLGSFVMSIDGQPGIKVHRDQ